jgi:hypothetical protein
MGLFRKLFFQPLAPFRQAGGSFVRTTQIVAATAKATAAAATGIKFASSSEVDLSEIPRRPIDPERVRAAKIVTVIFTLVVPLMVVLMMINDDPIARLAYGVFCLYSMINATISACRLRARRDGYTYLPISTWLNHFDPMPEIVSAFRKE